MQSKALSLLLFYLFCSLVACANSDSYNAASHYAGTKLKVGGIYAFKYGTAFKGYKLGHYRLVVVWVQGRKDGALKVLSIVSDQSKSANKYEAMAYTVECTSETSKFIEWDFSKKDGENKYQYLGEVKQGMTPEIVKSRGIDVTNEHKTYNLFFYNCGHYVDQLYELLESKEYNSDSEYEDIGKGKGKGKGKRKYHRSLESRSVDDANNSEMGFLEIKRDSEEFDWPPTLRRWELGYLNYLASRSIDNDALIARYAADFEYEF